jgi:hypothetical protein
MKNNGRSWDALSTDGPAHDVIVDHCSLTWATDENLTASGPRFRGETPADWRSNTSHRITFSHCIVGEGLNDSTHPKGPHSKGSLIHDNVTDIALIGNLYISNADRNPLFKGGTRGVFVNNLVHNPGERIVQFGYVSAQWDRREPQRALLSIVGNVARKGPSSAADMVFFEVWPDIGPCDLYLHDNLFFDQSGHALSVEPGLRDPLKRRMGPKPPTTGGDGFEFGLSAFQPSSWMQLVDSPPTWPPRLTARPAEKVTDWVLQQVGARPWDRDATDLRLIQEAKSGGGKILNDVSEIAGSPAR